MGVAVVVSSWNDATKVGDKALLLSFVSADAAAAAAASFMDRIEAELRRCVRLRLPCRGPRCVIAVPGADGLASPRAC